MWVVDTTMRWDLPDFPSLYLHYGGEAACMLKTLANFPTPQLGSLVHVHILQRLEACSKSLRIILVMYIYTSLVRRPLPDFVLQLWRKLATAARQNLEVAWGWGYTHTSVKRPACLCRSESSCLYVASLLTATLKKNKKNPAHFHFCNFQIS